MSVKNVILFYNEAMKKEDTKEKVNNWLEQDLLKEDNKKIVESEIIPTAQSMGFDFSYDEFIEYLKDLKSDKKLNLDSDELDSVSGGGGCFGDNKTYNNNYYKEKEKEIDKNTVNSSNYYGSTGIENNK